MICIDIETAPEPGREMLKFEPKTFDPNTVKTGDLDRLVDREKAGTKKAERLEAARQKHLAEEFIRVEKHREGATLTPYRGRVVAVGLGDTETGKITILEGDEREILKNIPWEDATYYPVKMAGWNVYGFDFPFLHRRYLKRRMRSPFWHPIWRMDHYTDLMLETSLGEMWGPFGCGGILRPTPETRKRARGGDRLRDAG